ncbi:MAG: hypothetical protein ACKVS9_14870 [Phycisphaerae bacterium]
MSPPAFKSMITPFADAEAMSSASHDRADVTMTPTCVAVAVIFEPKMRSVMSAATGIMRVYATGARPYGAARLKIS